MVYKFLTKKIMYSSFFFTLILFVFILLGLKNSGSVNAASIFPLPDKGNYSVGQTFTTSIIINGEGTAFNAAKVNIVPSENIQIQDIILGDCDFAFVNTPTINSPSFTGVILGDSSTKCTVYTLTLKALSSGQEYLSLSNGSVKAYKKSTEILSSLKNGVYTMSGSSNTQANSTSGAGRLIERLNKPQVEGNTGSDYKVIFGVKNEDGSPLPGTMVVLVSQESKEYRELSDAQGIVEFSNIPKGIYKVKTVFKDGKTSEKVLNIDGANKTIALGVQAKKKAFDYRWLLLLLIPLLFGVTVFIYLRIKRAKNKSINQ